ncbi:MAG: sugar phosphate isomerase/epimerase family protein [Planctomycetota bacterium]
MPGQLGVCSWSLRPESPRDLAEKVRATGLDALQLALDPLVRGAWDLDETRSTLEAAGLRTLSGMMQTVDEDYSSLESIRRTGGIAPDEHWDENLRLAEATADLAARLGLGLVTFHAGFIPHEAADPRREILLDRLRRLADVFAARDVALGLETGQESAGTLLEALDALDRPAVGVNFDPANMILYDMGDPVAALDRLAPRVLQIHLKDATRTKVPGTWGEEVPLGRGEVDWDAFFGTVRARGLDVDLVIEREAGEERIADVRTARTLAEARR